MARVDGLKLLAIYIGGLIFDDYIMIGAVCTERARIPAYRAEGSSEERAARRLEAGYQSGYGARQKAGRMTAPGVSLRHGWSGRRSGEMLYHQPVRRATFADVLPGHHHHRREYARWSAHPDLPCHALAERQDSAALHGLRLLSEQKCGSTKPWATAITGQSKPSSTLRSLSPP